MINKYYISFGQIHVHSVNGKTFDKDCLAEIEADSAEKAHNDAMSIFKGVFHMCYKETELPNIIGYFPRGVIKVNN